MRNTHPCRVEEKLIMREVEGKWIMKKKMRMISKDDTVSEFPGYTSSKEEEDKEEEEEEEEEDEDKDEEEEEEEDEVEEKEESEKKRSNEASEMGSNFEPPRYAAIDNEVESDLESTTRSEPKCKEIENTYESGDYDGKGGAVALTRWIKKMESVIENSRCMENQKVKYAASSFINKALTWGNTQVQARGREAAIAHWESAILKAGILTNEAVHCGTLTRNSNKRKEVEETSKQGGSWKDNKKAKVEKGFVATTPPRNENHRLIQFHY
ncbi:hypothetical protein Tco_0531967 [Tanacetum coccineum]